MDDFELTVRSIERVDSYVKKKIAAIRQKLLKGKQCPTCKIHEEEMYLRSKEIEDKDNLIKVLR